MSPGDRSVANDPWLTCRTFPRESDRGQPDLLRGAPVGLFASTVHVVDIGGLGMVPDGRQGL